VRGQPLEAWELADAACSRLRHAGVVLVHEHRGAEVRFAANTVTTNGVRRQRRLTVVAVHPAGGGFAAGVASAAGSAGWEQVVESADQLAARAEPAEDGSDLVAGGPEAGFEEPAGEVDLGAVGAALTPLGELLGQATAGGVTLAGFAEEAADTVYLASTTGLRRRHHQPTARLQVVGRTESGASSWAGAGASHLEELSLEALHGEVQRRLGWAERRVELPAGRYPTVLPADAVADLLCMLGEALGGRDAEDGRSVFSRPGGGTRVGDRLASWPVSVRSDPAEPGLSCLPFVATAASTAEVSVFDNGLGLGPTSWVEDGVLARLRYHRAGAQKSGVEPAPPIDNLVVSVAGARGDAMDLVAGLDRGLLVTCLWYIREVDPATLLLTGLTRDGVYLVERGEVTAAVNNFRWNESPVDLLARAGGFGETRRAFSREWNEWFPRTAMPPMLVPDFNMSSVSPAT
jgi:predicted Zn-dependent protease